MRKAGNNFAYCNINGLSELETETKQDCSHCQHQKYAEQISAIKAGKWEQKKQV